MSHSVSLNVSPPSLPLCVSLSLHLKYSSNGQFVPTPYCKFDDIFQGWWEMEISISILQFLQNVVLTLFSLRGGDDVCLSCYGLLLFTSKGFPYLKILGFSIIFSGCPYEKTSKNLVLPHLRGLLFLVGKCAHRGVGELCFFLFKHCHMFSFCIFI